jgi:uncharacterized protein YaaN involved in tellurite resistance
MVAATAVVTERKNGVASLDAKNGGRSDDLPSLETIRSNPKLYRSQNLDDKDLAEARKGAQSLNIDDQKQIVDFGIDEIRQASRMAAKTVEYSKKNDFKAIEEATMSMIDKMHEANVGELKPHWYDRFLPEAAAKRVAKVLRQHQDISEGTKVSLKSLAEEKKKLVTYRGAAEQDIDASMENIRRLDIRLAELELVQEAWVEKVAKYKEDNKDKSDEKTTQQLKHFEMVLALLASKNDFLVKARTDQFTSLENFRNYQATYNVLIQNMEDQANYMTQSFDNTVAQLTHASRQKGVEEVLNASRQAAGQWLKARGDAAVRTVENTMRVLQTGVVELERVTESIARAEEANIKLIEGCKSAQSKLASMSREVAERSKLASERTAQAARSSQEEVSNMLSEYQNASLPARH